jgi:S1-C subfamily serine protease
MGYPPLRGMREAPLISQKGEINALSKDWGNCDCITISSTVRPGNSGGPVISHNGYIVGIVTQYANSADAVSADKDGFKDNHSIPFYNAIASTGIVQILSELDNSIPILFENYQ